MTENISTPVVSIISLTYNHAPYIRECLDGFLMQKTNFPFEIIIHDDASTDGTTDIIREYATKYPEIIKHILQTENQYSKHNNFSRIIYECVCKSSGKYIALCEGDDYWTDSLKLQIQVDCLQSSPKKSMCYTRTRYYYQNTNKFRKDLFGGPYVTLQDLIEHPYCIPTATIMVKKDVYKNALEKHIMPNNWRMSDLPLSLSVALDSEICFINKETSVYRVLKSSACHFSNIERDLSFLESVYDVKRYYINQSNLNISNYELTELYNRDVWYRGISYRDFSISKKYSSYCKPKNLKEIVMKIACSNIVFFKLFEFLR